MDFEYYIQKAKAQLACNTSPAYQRDYITFQFTNKQIDNNLPYFRDCMNKGLSPFMALRLFYFNME